MYGLSASAAEDIVSGMLTSFQGMIHPSERLFEHGLRPLAPFGTVQVLAPTRAGLGSIEGA